MITIIITGLSCSGKTTATTYLAMKYNLPYLNLRRCFESLVGRDNAESIYWTQCSASDKGKFSWLTMIKPYLEEYKYNEYLLVEGINFADEINWFRNNITNSLVVVYLSCENRFDRFRNRYKLDEEATYARIVESDSWKNESQKDLKQLSSYRINNSSDESSFYEQLDHMIMQIFKMPILSTLCYDINKSSSYSFNPIELAYFIRQVGIAHGCRNACTHCFAESPYNIVQTELSGFAKVIKEIGFAVSKNGKPLKFFHLGASTDPAMVKDYVKYLAVWVNAMPSFQTVKIFSHGWDLSTKNGKTELTDIINLISTTNRDIRIILSFDCFSISARSNWSKYLKNILYNINLILNFIPKNKLRIEVFYPPERKKAPNIALLEWWRDQAIGDIHYEWKDVLNMIQTNSDITEVCAKTTFGLLKIFNECHLKFSDLIDMTRDCNMIFCAGRGTSFFKDKTSEYKEEGLNIQKKRVLYSLKDYEYGNNGIIVYPDGRIRFVDYEGFKLGVWINNGEPVINCMSIIKE